VWTLVTRWVQTKSLLQATKKPIMFQFSNHVSVFRMCVRICWSQYDKLCFGPKKKQIIALANLLPLEDTVDELDSFMFQTVRCCSPPPPTPHPFLSSCSF
jgi:hypothetical protein